MKRFFIAFTMLILLLMLALPALAEEEPYTGVMTASSLITIGVLLAGMAVARWFSTKKVKWDAALLARAALCIALSYIMGLIVIYRMPMGGSIKLIALLPIIVFSVAYGPLEGMLVGFVFGLLDLLIDPYVIHPIQLLVDYPMAYGAVALSCLGYALPLPKLLRLPAAVLLGYMGKYIMAVLSGVVFFAEYAGEQSALIYSLVYNITYVGIECALCMIVAMIPGVARLPELLKKRR